MKLQNLPAGLLVFCGGGVGALLRWLLTANRADSLLLVLGINLLGAFLLALLLTLLAFKDDAGNSWEPALRLGLGTGLLGGFTTYSTFSLQSAQLLLDGRVLTFLTYVLLSLVLGFTASYIGVKTGQKIVFHVKHKPKKGDLA